MRKISKVLFVLLLHSVWVCIVHAADESGAVQPATTEKYQKVRNQVETLENLPAGKRAPEVLEKARRSIATAQEGLKSGDDKMTREYSEMAALQVIHATALAEELDAAAMAENARKLLDTHETRLGAILSGKGDKQ
jgi:gamma-glutamylcysteine synthetase